MGKDAKPRQRGFAFNPDGLWGFRTLKRVRRRIIRVSSRKGLTLSEEEVDAWNDATDAGFTFSSAETTLIPQNSYQFVVIVGELIPEAARRERTFPERYKKPKETDIGLRKRLKWITLENEFSRCLVVRKIDSPDNIFHVLADKSTSDGLCALRAAPGLQTCRRYFAFYDEWAGSGEESTPGVMITSIKRNLNIFCKQSLEKLRPSITKPPVLSKEPITPVSKEGQNHAKAPPLATDSYQAPEKQSRADEWPSTIVTQTTKEALPKPLESQEQSKDASNSIPISSPLQTALEPAEPGQQPESEASSNVPQVVPHTEPAATELQNLARIEQNSKGCQTLQESPVQPSPSEMTKMDTCLARLFTVDDEYTASNALELLGEMKILQFFIFGDIRLRELYWRFGYVTAPWGTTRSYCTARLAGENTQQFARSASFRTDPVCDSLSVGQSESQKYGELAQIDALALAKGCIERTITFANIAVANLDAILPGHTITNDLGSGLRYALYNLREQLPALTDAFSIEMRNKILSLAHCAQIDGAMRIREVREVVMAIKVALETLLQNLDVVGKRINLSVSQTGNGFEGKVDKEGDCDMELGETIEEMEDGQW
ncbi:hypothetical protein MY11210_008681 [Beauveria gryllotalpidicola]